MGIVAEGRREIIVGGMLCEEDVGNLVLVIVLRLVEGICERGIGESWVIIFDALFATVLNVSCA